MALLRTHNLGFGIFFDKVGDMTPTIFIQFLSKFVATPQVMVFFHLRPLSTPSVPVENRYTVMRTIIPNCYRLVIRHGYTDEVVTENLSQLVYQQVRDFIIRESAIKTQFVTADKAKESSWESSLSTSSAENEPTMSELVEKSLAELQQAYNTQILYIVGKEQMRIRESAGLGRKVLLNAFLWLRENTRSKIANMKIPVDQLVEVGFIKEV